MEKTIAGGAASCQGTTRLPILVALAPDVKNSRYESP